MRILCKNESILLLSLFLIPRDLIAEPIVGIPKKRHQIIKDYNIIHRKFSKEMCSRGEEHKFNRLNKNFRGDGYFLPILPNGKLDRFSIREHLGEIKAKEKWLSGLIKDFSFPKYRKIKRDIRSMKRKIKELLLLKYEYVRADKGERKSIRSDSYNVLHEFKEQFNSLLKKIPFLLGFQFPVDHLELRKKYDTYKNRQDYKGKRKANSIYFLRSILEDGAQNPDHTKSDLYLRANINNVASSLDYDDLLSENLRYDLISTLDGIQKQLKRGRKIHLSRLKEWQDRTKRSYQFYLKANSNQLGHGDKLVKEKSKARYALQEYNRQKKEIVYRFWTKQNNLMRILFVMETILYNEAGGVDGRDALERKDIVQVIINRSKIPFYSTLTHKDEIFANLRKEPGNLSDYKWLNLLFKRGEFSFTYYFIPSSVRIYCPSMTRWGRFLRRENLRLSLVLLTKPNNDFTAVRYFSRHSMLGRIDMGILWNGFNPLRERPGRAALRGRFLKSLYRKGKYDYLYSFTGPDEREFKVIEIRGRNYVVSLDKTKFYRHRNPHHFKYFRVIP